MRGTEQTDSGSYIDGVYTSKNGVNNSGLVCPKGTRLYDKNVIQPLIFFPEDNAPGEDWRSISTDVAPDILPYYAISNYGRVMNTRSGKVMKENFRPNGYGYYCLAADNCKHGQKKYSTHRMVLSTFNAVENMNDLQVNHKNGVKSDNYVNKIMDNGEIKSNLEWMSSQENSIHRDYDLKSEKRKINYQDAEYIRYLHDTDKLSYREIVSNYYPNLSVTTIQNVCRNKIFVNDNYTPIDSKYFYSKPVSEDGYFKISDDDAIRIRKLNKDLNINAKDIWRNYYPKASYSTILDIVNGKSHNRT